MASYNDFDFCDHTRGIDNLLDRYLDDRYEIISMMEANPDELVETLWKEDSVLSIDLDCKCNLTNEVTTFACSQCKNLKKLVRLNRGAIGKPFLIECGSLAGTSLLITKVPITIPHLKRDNVALSRAKFYKQQYSKLKSCGTPEVTSVICGDAFTLETLVTWRVNKLFEDNGMNHSPILHTAFVCGDSGYFLSEVCEIARSMSVETVKSIITQLIVILKVLSEISFSHGNPIGNSLLFCKEPVSYEYDGVVVSGPVTLKITDFSNSSMTVNGAHYFPENVKNQLKASDNMFVPEIFRKDIVPTYCSTEEGKTCEISSAVLYKLSSKTMDLYNAIRHIGFPLYSGSFDFYCFIVGLMSSKDFREAVLNDDDLRRLWYMIWIDEDLVKVEKELEENNGVLNILHNKELRCDVLDHVWNFIKTSCW